MEYSNVDTIKLICIYHLSSLRRIKIERSILNEKKKKEEEYKELNTNFNNRKRIIKYLLIIDIR